jgi:hypothetical protein
VTTRKIAQSCDPGASARSSRDANAAMQSRDVPSAPGHAERGDRHHHDAAADAEQSRDEPARADAAELPSGGGAGLADLDASSADHPYGGPSEEDGRHE